MTEQATEKLFQIEDVYDYSDENSKLFLESVKEMFQFHYERSQIFRGICDQYMFALQDIQNENDIYRIPHIFVTAFKKMKILSLPEEEIVITLTSSGTQGQKSQTNLDQITLDRQTAIRANTVKSMGMLSEEKVNTIIFSYDPATGGDRGAAYTFRMYSSFAPSEEMFYALEPGVAGEPVFELEKSIEKIIEFSLTGLPLRVIGFLAFSFVTFKEMKKRGIKLQFPPSSLLLTGGGWKSHTGETVDFEGYAELVESVLGIKRDRIRDFFGMVEHGIPYMSCPQRHFHIPVYAKACAIDPGTLSVLPKGEAGLLKLITTFSRSVPSISVLSTDIGMVESTCPCGIPGDYIVLKGRGGVQKHAGCAISASQLIKI